MSGIKRIRLHDPENDAEPVEEVESVKRLHLVDPQPRYHQKPGRQPFVPTLEQRRFVERMAATDADQEEICQSIINANTQQPINRHTLSQYFKDEIAKGRARINARVAGSVLDLALGFHIERTKTVTDEKGKKKTVTQRSFVPPDLGAAIWWEKTRAGKRENAPIPPTNPDGSPISQQQTVVVILPSNGRNDGPPQFPQGSKILSLPDNGR